VTLEKGNLVLADVRGFHFDEGQYEDPTKFRVDRFMSKKDEGTNPEHANRPQVPVRPFGGGFHICKGRHFAVYEMKVLLILCVHLLDFTATHPDGSVLEGRPPSMDLRSQVGTVRPTHDVHLQIRKRVM